MDEHKPRVYVASKNVTIEWLAGRHETNTVCEYNIWDGDPFESDVVIHRECMLMEPAHDTILTLHTIFYSQVDTDNIQAVAELILTARDIERAHPVVTSLGYDFRMSKPTLKIHALRR